MYGVDVAALRADDLDKKMLAYASAHRGCMVLDLGAGAGAQAERLAAAGAHVLAIDLAADRETAAVTRVQDDMRNFMMHTHGTSYELCCIQRAIHYVPYQAALQLLLQVRLSGVERLFISVTGIESDIGKNYADAGKVVSERFCTLPAVDAETFSIHEPVCLYTPEEFIALLQQAGWEVQECWVSAFGNIKAVCTQY